MVFCNDKFYGILIYDETLDYKNWHVYKDLWSTEVHFHERDRALGYYILVCPD